MIKMCKEGGTIKVFFHAVVTGFGKNFQLFQKFYSTFIKFITVINFFFNQYSFSI